jgi:hypothetical protein
VKNIAEHVSMEKCVVGFTDQLFDSGIKKLEGELIGIQVFSLTILDEDVRANLVKDNFVESKVAWVTDVVYTL